MIPLTEDIKNKFQEGKKVGVVFCSEEPPPFLGFTAMMDNRLQMNVVNSRCLFGFRCSMAVMVSSFMQSSERLREMFAALGD